MPGERGFFGGSTLSHRKSNSRKSGLRIPPKGPNGQKTYKKPNEAKKLILQLGQVLLQFRWRIMCWELSGDGGANDQISKQRYIQRLQSLTKVLHFHYGTAKAKLPGYLAADGLQGTQSFYPGTAPFFDSFPHANTIPGFEAWMNQGKDLVSRTQAERVAGKVNPIQNILFMPLYDEDTIVPHSLWSSHLLGLILFLS
jgi:hypothetical protein